MCDCYKIGGPWIAEDPDCPIHGTEAQRAQRYQEEQASSAQDRIESLEARVAELERIIAAQKKSGND